MKPALVILAAGMGSRYGGLKQLDPMGPNGETVLDYSVMDATRAGFGKVVFVIRRDFADAFRSAVGGRMPAAIETRYCYQELDDLPAPYSPPPGRTRPWGTAHAVRAAREAVDEPFAVINADDFYGRDAYQRLAEWAAATDPSDLAACMIGYPLRNTLSDHGSVNRGICRTEKGRLTAIEEHTDIATGEDGLLSGRSGDGGEAALDPGALVSMNFWGFTPALFPALEEHFTRFLQASATEDRSECYLPAVVDSLIREQGLDVPAIETSGTWFGVTYPGDKPRVVSSIRALVDAGEYPG